MSSLRIKILLCCAVTVPLGFVVKFYGGPGSYWCNAYGAAILYEIFWCFCVFFFFPSRRNIPIIAAAVFFITCVLETMQLWHPPVLEAVRRTHIGVWIIGNCFDWLDFPHYVFGCALGWAAMRMLDRR